MWGPDTLKASFVSLKAALGGQPESFNDEAHAATSYERMGGGKGRGKPIAESRRAGVLAYPKGSQENDCRLQVRKKIHFLVGSLSKFQSRC